MSSEQQSKQVTPPGQSRATVLASLRDSELSAANLAELEDGRRLLHARMHGELDNLLDDYLAKLNDQILKEPNNEKLINRNSRLSCDLHAHKLMLFRNVRLAELDAPKVKRLIGGFIYLTTRHTWNTVPPRPPHPPSIRACLAVHDGCQTGT